MHKRICGVRDLLWDALCGTKVLLLNNFETLAASAGQKMTVGADFNQAWVKQRSVNDSGHRLEPSGAKHIPKNGVLTSFVHSLLQTAMHRLVMITNLLLLGARPARGALRRYGLIRPVVGRRRRPARARRWSPPTTAAARTCDKCSCS